MSYKSELIRKLFSDRLKKDELKDLSEIDMIAVSYTFDSSIIRWQQPVWL